MKRAKDIVFISLISFALLTLAGLILLSTVAGVFGGDARGEEAINAYAADVADYGFTLFMYSVLIGASFLIFDIKGLPAFCKRALHLVLNYVLMLACFLWIARGNHYGKGLMLFVCTFIFIAVYYLGMLICRGLGKWAAVLDEIKKSKKI